MSRKTKSLGPANMVGVPDDELIVAKLIQTARDRGLRSCRGHLLLNRNGRVLQFWEAHEAVACCALGAHNLDPDQPLTGCSGMSVSDGNDGLPDREGDSRGYDIGAAFYDALADGDE